jgi:hypothetical protein
MILVFLTPNHNREIFSTNISTLETSSRSYLLDKDLVDQYPLSEVMAAIAYHECFNQPKLERWLIMEAFLNRIEDNFNNNGPTVKEQLLAPKQFTGLWLFYPEQFKFDESDPIILENKKMAEYILAGLRVSSKRIYYWAGTCDMKTSHGRWVKKDNIKLPKIIKTIFR